MSIEASWPGCVENVQIFPFAGFVWWLCRYLYNRNSFCIHIAHTHTHTHILPNGQDLVTFNLIRLIRSGIDHSWLLMYVFQGDKPVFFDSEKNLNIGRFSDPVVKVQQEFVQTVHSTDHRCVRNRNSKLFFFLDYCPL